MSKKVTVILQDDKKLIYENAKVTKGRKITIYEVDEHGQIMGIHAEFDPYNVKSFYTE